MSSARVGLPVIAFVAAISCGGGGSDGVVPTFEPKLSVIEREIFAKSCAFSACHGELTPREGLSLIADTHAQLVDVPSKQVGKQLRVKPGDPDASYLIEKLTKQRPTVGERMPEGQPPLEPGSIETIIAWIRAGALAD